MKQLMLVLLACMGLSSCVVVPERVARVDREVYVSPPGPVAYYPSYTYRYYTY